jgi:hypothetical protein
VVAFTPHRLVAALWLCFLTRGLVSDPFDPGSDDTSVLFDAVVTCMGCSIALRGQAGRVDYIRRILVDEGYGGEKVDFGNHILPRIALVDSECLL